MKLALFDIDGTLTDTVGLCDELFGSAIAQVAGVPEVTLDWRLAPDSTDSGLAAAHFRHATGRTASADELQEIHDHFVAALSAAQVSAPAVPGAHDVFDRVARYDGWCAAIATGNWRAAARVKFGWVGLAVPDVPMGCADDATARADILRAAVARAATHFGVERFDRAVYFGDGVHDVRAARQLGMGFVAVTAVRPRDALHAAGAREFLSHFGDDSGLRRAMDRAPIPTLAPEGPLGR